MSHEQAHWDRPSSAVVHVVAIAAAGNKLKLTEPLKLEVDAGVRRAEPHSAVAQCGTVVADLEAEGIVFQPR